MPSFCAAAVVRDLAIRAGPPTDRTASVQCIDVSLSYPRWEITNMIFTAVNYSQGNTIGDVAFTAKSFTLNLNDPDNAQGYVEIAKLVAGVHWSPSRNVAWGASLTYTDRSKNYTMDGSGRTATDFGTRARKLNVNCAQMLEPDRAALQRILRANGIGHGMWISLDPFNASKEFTREHSLWAKLTTIGAMTLPNWNEFTAPLEVLEVL